MIASLMKEHDALRKQAAEVEKELGENRDVGWNDCTVCDLSKLRAAQERLSKSLLAHEDREKKVLTDAFEKTGGDPAAFGREIEKSHRMLAHLMGLMKTVSTLCDGTHVYAVRTAVQRVRQELESHLVQEEKILFPLLKETSRRRTAKAR